MVAYLPRKSTKRADKLSLMSHFLLSIFGLQCKLYVLSSAEKKTFTFAALVFYHVQFLGVSRGSEDFID